MLTALAHPLDAVRVLVPTDQIDSLAAHLCDQGFPADRVAPDELAVLFPGSAGIFAAAAELDLWEARGGRRSSVVFADV
jgi:hypothetical protein